MAAVPELHLQAVVRWCAQRVPERARHQVRVEHQVRGRNVTIVERRAPWSPDIGPEWTSYPVAQLRYSPQDGRWRLYWSDRNRHWHLVPDVPPAPSPTPLLEVVDADPTGAFWG